MDTTLSLETPPDIVFARVLTSAAETMARSRGLSKRESLRFQLAVEEFYTYLVQVARIQKPIRTEFTGKAYQLCASFRFQASSLNLGALNASTVATLSGDCDVPHELGLILAGRVADRFRITRDNETTFTLHVEVDKVYPPFGLAASSIALRPPYTAAVERDPDRLLCAATLAAASYPAWHCPASFQTPGKFADMVQAGHFVSVAALDAASNPAGLLCWTKSGEKGLVFSGPFVFAPPGDAALVARMLADAFLAAVARENVEIVFSERATADMPEGYFEALGTLTRYSPAGQAEQPVLYRHLREDMGATVWADPALEDFLRGAYDRLDMCRDVLPAPVPTYSERQGSLFSTMMDKEKNLAVLRPLLDGEDTAGNLAGHVRTLSDKGVLNILLYLDLSHAWEAALAGPALGAGFEARLVLPHAGFSDVAVFQYAPSR